MNGKPTSTVLEFCSDHNISRTHLYSLWKQGKGPRVMKVGMKTLISTEAATEWRAAMEGPFDAALAVGLKPWSATKTEVPSSPADPAPKRPRGRPRKTATAVEVPT